MRIMLESEKACFSGGNTVDKRTTINVKAGKKHAQNKIQTLTMNSLNNLLHQDWVALTPAVISVAALYIDGGKVGTFAACEQWWE